MKKTASEIRELFSQHQGDLAFILGNGINLHYQKNNVSWYKLLLNLWNAHTNEPMKDIPEGISFIEFYDALGLQNVTTSNFASQLQKDVKNRMIDWMPDTAQNLVLNKIQELNAPILTTNFDDLMPKSMELKLRNIPKTSFTDFYPWSSYYADAKLKNPLEGFGIWYMNGMVKYHRSIKLGLSQYMGNVERAREIIIKNHRYYKYKGNHPWHTSNTWLDIIFNKSLCIIGLSLDETEVFLRWLLIERAKLFKRFPEYDHKGWYFMKSSSKDASMKGKKFFLKSVGIEVVEVDNYSILYEDIWK